MATGFNNTPPASEFHRHSSWGRTRQPKNLAGPHGVLLHDASTTLPTAEPTLATDGYITENQRFLHLMIANDANSHTHEVTVWGFSYASGKWAELYDVDGNQVKVQKVNQACDDYYIFEVAGVDRLYFRDTGNEAFHSDDRIAAAMSTF